MLLALDAQRDINGVGWGVYQVKTSRLLELLGGESGVRSWVDPFRLVVSRR